MQSLLIQILQEKNFSELAGGTLGLQRIFLGADSFDGANYSAFLIALERTNSGYATDFRSDLGLGQTLTPEGRRARDRLVRDHRWSVAD